MRYNDKIDKTEAQMLDVIESIQELGKDRFIASLFIRNCSPLDVDIRLAEVRRCLAFAHKETLSLAKLELTYNKDFSVIDNKRFATAERLFNRLRSSMACIRKTLRRSCPRSNKKLFNPNIRPSIFERSVLTKGCCGRDLYEITTFDDNVQALYYEQQTLFANIILSLAICYRVIKEEKEIKSNPDRCLERLLDQCQRILEDMKDVLAYSKDIPEPEIQRMINEKGLRGFAGENFHQIPLDEFRNFALYTAQLKAREGKESQQLLSVFRNEEKGKDALLLLSHFDEVMPSNRRMMDSLKIRLFCNWCDGKNVDNPKQIYYRILVNNYHGKHEMFPDWHAVTTSKNRKGLDIMKEQQKFNQEVDALLTKLKHNQINVA